MGRAKFQEFGDHVREGTGLLEDALRIFSDVVLGFAANHLRVAGNRGERILEFVRDAGGKFSKRGQAFLHEHLALEGQRVQ